MDPPDAWCPDAIPTTVSTLLKIFLRKPRWACPSFTSIYSSTSSAVTLPKQLDSAQVSFMMQYRAILSVGREPSEPTLLIWPVMPKSLQWSLAALESLSLHLRGGTLFWVLRNSIASWKALGPSSVLIALHPSSVVYMLPWKRFSERSRYGMKLLGFCLTLFYRSKISLANDFQSIFLILRVRALSARSLWPLQTFPWPLIPSSSPSSTDKGTTYAAKTPTQQFWASRWSPKLAAKCLWWTESMFVRQVRRSLPSSTSQVMTTSLGSSRLPKSIAWKIEPPQRQYLSILCL